MQFPQWLPDDPSKKAAAKQGLIQFGAALMGGRGNFGEILGQGLQTGAQGYHGALAQQQQQALQAMQAKHMGLQNQKLQAEVDEPQALANIAQGIGQPAGVKPLSALPQIGQSKEAPAAAPAAQAPATGSYEYYTALAQRYAAAGKNSAAKTAMDLADKARPKIKEQKAVMRDGKRVLVNVDEFGQTTAVDGFAPDAEKLSFQNTGGSTVAFDPYTGKPVNTIQNTQSPDSVARVAQDERERKSANERSDNSLNAMRGQIIMTDSGPMLANTREGTARPVLGPDGAALAPKMKQLPAPIQKALLENDAALRKVDAALKAVKAYPQAFGATNYLGDTIRQRTDPDGVKPRALVADIGSLKLHDRSGAAVTAAETPRLKPFIPDARDNPETVTKKLELFQQEYEMIQSDINETYTREQGYRAPVKPKSVPEPAAKDKVPPVDKLPKLPPAAKPYADAEKERRYQEWKRSQNK